VSKKSKAHLRIALIGASGRMGGEIEKAAESEGCEIAVKIHSSADWKKTNPGAFDVAVDFSSPEGLSAAIAYCMKHKKGLVSGVTGLNKAQGSEIEAAAKKIPILYSANMSLGIAAFTAMIGSLKMLDGWDFQIEEVHHNQKKDKPSGTALLLQKAVNATLKRSIPEPQSLRGGGVPGIHTLWAMGPEETLTIQHTAFNRGVFARGALKAARWLFDKGSAGLYDLSHLYKSKN
jgi:4-hydroxy-tetrahydrodipicolinate reductase